MPVVLSKTELAVLRDCSRNGRIQRYTDGYRTEAGDPHAYSARTVFTLERMRALQWTDGTTAAEITQRGRDLVSQADQRAIQQHSAAA